MRLSSVLVFTLILSSLTCFPQTTVGQTLSIRDYEGQLWVEASAPADARYVLQVSKDLRLWLDINDTVSGVASNKVGVTEAGQCYFRLVPWTEPSPIRIALLGDSTVADLESNLGYFYGWGAGMYQYFKPAAQVINLAYPGLGTKNFLVSDQKARMLAIKPEYVLIDLFYVDAFNGPPETTTTLEEYDTNLRTIVEVIHDFGGTPILFTPQAVQAFDADHKAGPAYPERHDVIRKVADDMKTYVIDLSALSVDLMNQLGEEGCKPLFMDWLHFSENGARLISGLVVGALPSPLGRYVITEKILTL